MEACPAHHHHQHPHPPSRCLKTSETCLLQTAHKHVIPEPNSNTSFAATSVYMYSTGPEDEPMPMLSRSMSIGQAHSLLPVPNSTNNLKNSCHHPPLWLQPTPMHTTWGPKDRCTLPLQTVSTGTVPGRKNRSTQSAATRTCPHNTVPKDRAVLSTATTTAHTHCQGA